LTIKQTAVIIIGKKTSESANQLGENIVIVRFHPNANFQAVMDNQGNERFSEIDRCHQN
jgi:hypothetical protein